MHGLTFCLLGVATPSDLIQDVGMTPFNIGRRIELRDFTPEEAAPLGVGCRVLGVGEKEAQRLIARILHWTGGHPYMTQRLCQALVETQKAEGEKGSKGEGESPLPESPTPYTLHPTPSLVDCHCEALFLSSQARQADDHLLFVRRRMLESGADVAGVLDLYGKVRAGRRVPDDEANPIVSVLRLSGIARSVGGLLEVRNRIYAHVFDTAWIAANSPDAELRRQRAAFRRALIGTASVLGTIIFVMGWVLAFKALSAKRQADEQSRLYRKASLEAEQNRIQSDKNAQSATLSANREYQEKRRANQEKAKALIAMNAAKDSALRAHTVELIAKKERDRANHAARKEQLLRQKHQNLSSKIYKVSSRYFNVNGDEGEGAEGYYTAQLEYFTLLNKTSEIAASLSSIGNFCSKREKYDQAENYYLRAMTLYQKIGNKQKIAEGLTILGDLHNYQKHFAVAKRYYIRALLLYETLRPKNEIGSLCNKLGEVYSQLAQWNEARDYFVRAYALAVYYDEKINLRRALANVYKHLGQPEKAQEYYNRAH